MKANEVNQIIDHLAEKFGVVGETLWEALLKQAPIHGWIGLADLFFCLALPVVFVISAFHCGRIQKEMTARKEPNNDGYGFAALILLALGVGIGLLSVGAVFTNLPTIWAAFFNPEYWILMHILEAS